MPRSCTLCSVTNRTSIPGWQYLPLTLIWRQRPFTGVATIPKLSPMWLYGTTAFYSSCALYFKCKAARCQCQGCLIILYIVFCFVDSSWHFLLPTLLDLFFVINFLTPHKNMQWERPFNNIIYQYCCWVETKSLNIYLCWLLAVCNNRLAMCLSQRIARERRRKLLWRED